jgi:hypothetical protein
MVEAPHELEDALKRKLMLRRSFKITKQRLCSLNGLAEFKSS